MLLSSVEAMRYVFDSQLATHQTDQLPHNNAPNLTFFGKKISPNILRLLIAILTLIVTACKGDSTNS